jgi:TRAP-type C4-dicarboxylate transport system substrate-binding protein
VQAIVSRNFTTYALQQRADTERLNRTLGSTLTRHGMVINEADPNPFRARLASFYQSSRSQFGPTAWSLLEKYSVKLAS